MKKIKKLVLSFSTINEWRLCPRRGHLLATQGYQRIGYRSHPNLYMGKAGHKALETLYAGQSIDWAALAAEFELPAGNSLRQLVEDYVSYNQVSKMREAQFDVLKIEEEYTFPLTENIFMRGHIDLVVKTRSEELAILDHKFSTNPGRYTIPKIESSEQLSGYCWLASQAFGQPINLVGFNGIALDPKVRGADRFVRGWTYRADWQIQEYVANATYWARQIRAWLESGFVPTDCEHGRNAFNTTCPLVQYCDAAPAEREAKLLSDYEKVANELGAVVEWEK